MIWGKIIVKSIILDKYILMLLTILGLYPDFLPTILEYNILQKKKIEIKLQRILI
jgi:hypothetical protein